MSDLGQRVPATPGRRRKRLTDDVTRARMFEAAREVLDDQGGLTVSLEHLSFEEIIQRAAVSRSAAYRLWPYRDSFYEDLLVELAQPTERGTAEVEQEVVAVAAEVIDRRKGDLATVDGRASVLYEACRVAADQHFDGMVANAQWRTYAALTVTGLSLAEESARSRVADTLRDTQRVFLDRMAGYYELLAGMLGYRLRPEYVGDFRTFAAMASAMASGLGQLHLILPEYVDKQYFGTKFTDKGSQDQPWRLPSVGFTALVDAMLEPDPEFTAAT